jgi:hypothetical protein
VAPLLLLFALGEVEMRTTGGRERERISRTGAAREEEFVVGCVLLLDRCFSPTSETIERNKDP